MSADTHVGLELVTFQNNTAAAGGAVATIGGSTVTCSTGCRFAYNRARVSIGKSLLSTSCTCPITITVTSVLLICTCEAGTW